ncbi:MAG: hypothetical protein LQ341_005092 [Variospora aurantia]|nr:MAG: hypothetical protein LQ341_005092 [Variospora aurantia]
MRLLHAERIEFAEFFDTQIPEYLILSHRWGEKEVSYQQMRKNRAETGPGLAKIHAFCTLALQKGYEWVWIDTCCIDKKSSAELSEAINSMFHWYSNAVECVVYLSDVLTNGHHASDKDFDVEFSASAWFTRGWTVQELLAPRQLTLYDADWKEMGGKSALAAKIATITGIGIQYIWMSDTRSRRDIIEEASVATRMSWVSGRQTSRSEDIAYCMLGLFDVNMPLLYGEGAVKAFLRLQSEILSKAEDETIFAWTSDPHSSGFSGFSSLLASEPRFFANSGDYSPIPVRDSQHLRYWMTNRGLALQIPMNDLRHSWENEGIFLELCVKRNSDDQVMGIQICRHSKSKQWTRSQSQLLVEMTLIEWIEREGSEGRAAKGPPVTLYFPQFEVHPIAGKPGGFYRDGRQTKNHRGRKAQGIKYGTLHTAVPPRRRSFGIEPSAALANGPRYAPMIDTRPRSAASR